MKKLFVLVIFFSLWSCGQPGAADDSSVLAPQAFAEKLKSNADIVLLDVRSSEEMLSGYLKGAQHLDFNSPGFRSSLDSLDHSRTYLVYCASGKRSGKALDMMKGIGFQKVRVLEGGLNAWITAGFPVQQPFTF